MPALIPIVASGVSLNSGMLNSVTPDTRKIMPNTIVQTKIGNQELRQPQCRTRSTSGIGNGRGQEILKGHGWTQITNSLPGSEC